MKCIFSSSLERGPLLLHIYILYKPLCVLISFNENENAVLYCNYKLNGTDRKLISIFSMYTHFPLQEPGQQLYPGIHNVRYIASDAAGNRAECHFSIHVRGTKFMRHYSSAHAGQCHKFQCRFYNQFSSSTDMWNARTDFD